jgi:phosphoketolase
MRSCGIGRIEEQSLLSTVYNPDDQYRDRHKWLKTDKGYSFYAFASERRDKIIQPYLITAHKGEVKQYGFSHDDEEFIYMINDQMHYKVGSTDFLLQPGDALYFNSLEDHILSPVTEEVTYLAVFSQKSYESD